MKATRILLAAALGAFAALTAAPGAGPDGPDQRGRGDVPVPDLLEVVFGVQQAPPRSRDQLPVDRLGRRHPPALEPDRLLRSDGRSDDDRTSIAGRAGARSCTCRRCSAASCPIYNIPGVERRAEVHGQGDRRHHARQDHEVERHGDHGAQSRASSSRTPTSPSPTAPTARGRPTSSSTISRRSRRTSRRRWASRPPSTGRSASAARATRASRAWSSRRRARSDTSSSSTRMQNKIAYGSVQNMDGEFVTLEPRIGDRGGGRGRVKAMPKDFRVSITNAPGKGAYPISSFTWLLFYENPKDKAAREGHGRLHEVGPDGRAEVLRGPRLRAASGGSRRARDGGPEADQALGRPKDSRMSKTPSSRRSADDRGFRLGTGFLRPPRGPSRGRNLLGALPDLAPLDREVRIPILDAGGPGTRSRASSARCRSSGARSTPRSSRCSSRRRSRSASRSFSRSSSPRRLRTPLAFLTELLAAIPSIVYGLWGVFVLVPLVRQLQVVTPAWMKKIPLFSGPPLGVGMRRGGAHPRRHGDSVHLLGRPRGPARRSRRRSERPLTPWARRAGRRSRPPCGSDGPASSAPSSSGSAGRSAKRWR